MTSLHKCFFVLCSVLFGMSACVSMEYAAINSKNNFGYKERLQEDGSYVLTVVLPAMGNRETSLQYWHRRAKELCEGEDYKHNLYRALRPTVRYDSYGGRAGGFILEGYLTCMNTEAVGSEA